MRIFLDEMLRSPTLPPASGAIVPHCAKNGIFCILLAQCAHEPMNHEDGLDLKSIELILKVTGLRCQAGAATHIVGAPRMRNYQDINDTRN